MIVHLTNTAGNSTVTIDGNTGINAGNLKVTNVADGVADKDAVKRISVETIS